MKENEWLADRFEERRTHLRAIAYRMLGSLAEADDAMQDAWIRLSRSDVAEVENLDGWLTTNARNPKHHPASRADKRRRWGGRHREGTALQRAGIHHRRD